MHYLLLKNKICNFAKVTEAFSRKYLFHKKQLEFYEDQYFDLFLNIDLDTFYCNSSAANTRNLFNRFHLNKFLSRQILGLYKTRQ